MWISLIRQGNMNSTGRHRDFSKSTCDISFPHQGPIPTLILVRLPHSTEFPIFLSPGEIYKSSLQFWVIFPLVFPCVSLGNPTTCHIESNSSPPPTSPVYCLSRITWHALSKHTPIATQRLLQLSADKCGL